MSSTMPPNRDPNQWGPHPHQQPQSQPSGPAPKPKGKGPMNKTRFALMGLSAALVIAVVSCTAAASNDGAAPEPLRSGQPVAPAPTVTVTSTAPAPDAEEVPVTPQACLDALDDSDALITLVQKGFSISSDMVQHAAAQDASALSDDTDRLEALTPKVRKARDKYDASAEECQNS